MKITKWIKEVHTKWYFWTLLILKILTSLNNQSLEFIGFEKYYSLGFLIGDYIGILILSMIIYFVAKGIMSKDSENKKN